MRPGLTIALVLAACAAPRAPAPPSPARAPLAAPPAPAPPSASVAPASPEAGATEDAVELATVPGAQALLVDDRDVYLLDDDPRLGAVPKAGGAPRELVRSEGVVLMTSWQSFTQDATRVFFTYTASIEQPRLLWLDMPGIASVAKDAGASVKFQTALARATSRRPTGQPGLSIVHEGVVVRGAAVDGAWFYWLEGPPGMEMTADRLVAAPIGGGSPHVVARHLAGATELAVDASDAFVLVQHGVVRVPLRGGAPAPIATGLAAPHALLLDAEHVYFLDGTSVLRVAKRDAKSTPEPVVVDLPEEKTQRCVPGCVALDADTLYWTTPGSVMSTGTTAPSGRDLLATGDAIGPIAVDQTNVYYVDGKTLKRIPKGGLPVRRGTAPLDR